MNPPIGDPAVLLAAIRATGGLSLERTDSRVVDAARRSAESAGRALVTCLTGTAHQRGSGRGLALGWLPHSTPAPEDSGAYPVRSLSPVAILTWACCLGLAWPDRAAALYPGVPFTRSEVLEVSGELGVSTVWVKSVLFRTLMPARLVMIEGTFLRLGPATAALPEPFVDAMRRFHDRLPRLEPRPLTNRDAELDEAELEDLLFEGDGEDPVVTYGDLIGEEEIGETSYDPWDEG